MIVWVLAGNIREFMYLKMHHRDQRGVELRYISTLTDVLGKNFLNFTCYGSYDTRGDGGVIQREVRRRPHRELCSRCLEERQTKYHFIGCIKNTHNREE